METFEEWLQANTRRWHGWPTRTLFQDGYDARRLHELCAAMPSGALQAWFKRSVRDQAVLFAEISSEIANLRLKERRKYAARVGAA